jgi:hypothetical protein
VEDRAGSVAAGGPRDQRVGRRLAEAHDPGRVGGNVGGKPEGGHRRSHGQGLAVGRHEHLGRDLRVGQRAERLEQRAAVLAGCQEQEAAVPGTAAHVADHQVGGLGDERGGQPDRPLEQPGADARERRLLIDRERGHQARALVAQALERPSAQAVEALGVGGIAGGSQRERRLDSHLLQGRAQALAQAPLEHDPAQRVGVTDHHPEAPRALAGQRIGAAQRAQQRRDERGDRPLLLLRVQASELGAHHRHAPAEALRLVDLEAPDLLEEAAPRQARARIAQFAARCRTTHGSGQRRGAERRDAAAGLQIAGGSGLGRLRREQPGHGEELAASHAGDVQRGRVAILLGLEPDLAAAQICLRSHGERRSLRRRAIVGQVTAHGREPVAAGLEHPEQTVARPDLGAEQSEQLALDRLALRERQQTHGALEQARARGPRGLRPGRGCQWLAKGALDGRRQRVAIDGLEQVVAGARAHRGHRGARIADAAEHQDALPGPALAQPGQRVDAVGVLQHQVHHHEVAGPLALEQFPARRGAGRGRDGKTALSQQGLDEAPEVRLVIDDQDARLAGQTSDLAGNGCAPLIGPGRAIS